MLACGNQVKQDVVSKIDSTEYPLLIDGGNKVVYQFGKMTADKGLKLYLDTITFAEAELHLRDSLRLRQ